LGLFGKLTSEAYVMDLGVVDVNIIGSGDYVGGLVGENNGIITKCYSTGSVSGRGRIGGLAGANIGDGSITYCYAICTVLVESEDMWWWDESSGGLIGANIGSGGWYTPEQLAIVSDCYSIVLENSRVSGLFVGQNGYSSEWYSYPGKIVNCYASCDGSGLIETFGFSGYTVWSGEVLNCFWDAGACGLDDNGEGGILKTTAEMQTANTFLEAGWDFVNETANGTEDIWWIDEGQDYPRLWWELIPEN
jgi:hypothetical protein